MTRIHSFISLEKKVVAFKCRAVKQIPLLKNDSKYQNLFFKKLGLLEVKKERSENISSTDRNFECWSFLWQFRIRTVEWRFRLIAFSTSERPYFFPKNLLFCCYTDKKKKISVDFLWWQMICITCHIFWNLFCQCTNIVNQWSTSSIYCPV